jgi:hypothetical protein
MTAPARRPLIATLLLASYGLISACGSGLHALAEGTHGNSTARCSSEGHDPAPVPPSGDHGDCVICHVAEQGQLLVQADPIGSQAVELGEAPTPPTADHRPPDRLPGEPRAPPLPLS